MKNCCIFKTCCRCYETVLKLYICNFDCEYLKKDRNKTNNKSWHENCFFSVVLRSRYSVLSNVKRWRHIFRRPSQSNSDSIDDDDDTTIINNIKSTFRSGGICLFVSNRIFSFSGNYSGEKPFWTEKNEIKRRFLYNQLSFFYIYSCRALKHLIDCTHLISS